jgi:AcrR family transcriptional regulator
MSKTQRIVQAAGERFRYYGIAKTTMQEIAQDAGVAVGTLYLYFKNKDALVVACAADFVHRHRQEAQAILAARMPAEEKLRAYLVGRFRASEETRTGSRHAVELTRAVLRLKPDRLQEEGEMMWQTVAAILAQGVESRSFEIASVQGDAKVLLFSVAYFFPNALTEIMIPPTEADLLSVINWFIEAWKRGRRPAKTVRAPKAGRAKA